MGGVHFWGTPHPTQSDILSLLILRLFMSVSDARGHALQLIESPQQRPKPKKVHTWMTMAHGCSAIHMHTRVLSVICKHERGWCWAGALKAEQAVNQALARMEMAEKEVGDDQRGLVGWATQGLQDLRTWLHGARHHGPCLVKGPCCVWALAIGPVLA